MPPRKRPGLPAIAKEAVVRRRTATPLLGAAAESQTDEPSPAAPVTAATAPITQPAPQSVTQPVPAQSHPQPVSQPPAPVVVQSASQPEAASAVDATESIAPSAPATGSAEEVSRRDREMSAPRVPASEVALDPNNPVERTANVDDIASTIATVGIMQPIAVVDAAAYLKKYPKHRDKIGDARYVAIDGNRRLKAAKDAGVDIPIHVDNSLIEESNDNLARVIANLNREDYSPIDEAREYAAILDDARHQGRELSIRELAAQLGTTHSNIVKKLLLLKLAPQIQEVLKRKNPVLTVSDAYELAKTFDNHDDQLAAFNLVNNGQVKKVRSAIIKVKHAKLLDGAASPKPDEKREQAIRERDLICVKLVSSASDEEKMRLIARHVVRAGKTEPEAIALAQQWMRQAGIGQPVEDPAAFTAAALRDQDVIATYAYAIALAEEEVHARDPRRSTWDTRAVGQYDRLRAAGYTPTEWDAEHLPET